MNLSIRSCFPSRTIHIEPIVDEQDNIVNYEDIRSRVSLAKRIQGFLERSEFRAQLHGISKENIRYENFFIMEFAYINLGTQLSFLSGDIPDLLHYSVFRNFLQSLKLIKINTIPNTLFSLTNLIKLNIDNSYISSLPDEIENLSNLRILIITNHKLKELPKTIGNLSHLQNLRINGSHVYTTDGFGFGISNIPNEFKNLKNLKHLDLAHNQLSSLPEQFLSSKIIDLDLSFNRFKSLPKDFCNLTNLKYLNLARNRLETLPEDCSRLEKLEILYLSDNDLSLPMDWIGNCNSLTYLDLRRNQFRNFPFKIRSLQKLEYLHMSDNFLTQIPNEFNTLVELKDINLRNNQLTSIPNINNLQKVTKIDLSVNHLFTLPNIDHLPLLKEINVNSNWRLDSLPITLGNCSQLLAIGIFGTNIPQAQAHAILDRAKALRKGQHLLLFPIRVNSWLAYSANTLDFKFLFEEHNFSQEQQMSINEWLLRLEATKEFERSRTQLAALVCSILDSLRPSTEAAAAEFKNAFFGHLDGNLENCGDRAAMLLNLIYIDWQLLMSDKNSSDKQKMELLVGIAKTQTLRKVLQKKLIELRSDSILGVVETYLYYETHLKPVLGLVTAVNSMLYADIGRISAIDDSKLIRDVNSQYLDALCQLPALDSILEKNEKYRRAKELIITSTEEQMSALEDQEWSQEGEYMKAMNDIKEKRESEILALKKKFIKV